MRFTFKYDAIIWDRYAKAEIGKIEMIQRVIISRNYRSSDQREPSNVCRQR